MSVHNLDVSILSVTEFFGALAADIVTAWSSPMQRTWDADLKSLTWFTLLCVVTIEKLVIVYLESAV
jgi:hypothetical protein